MKWLGQRWTHLKFQLTQPNCTQENVTNLHFQHQRSMGIFASSSWRVTHKNSYIVLIWVSHAYAGEIEHLLLYLLAIYISSLNLLSFSICNRLNIFLRIL